MRKYSALVLGLIFFVASGNTGYTYAQSTKTYDYKNFESVGVSSGMNIKITQSDNYFIKVTGDKDDLEDIVVDNYSDRLSFKFENYHSRHHGKVNIEITMPKLTGLRLSGGSAGNIKMDIGSNSFSAGLSGGSELRGNLKCGNANLATSGSSVIDLNGTCNNIKLAGSGGSEYHLKNFSAGSVKAALSGGCEAAVRINGKLSFNGSGGSQLVYYGNAEPGSIRAIGGSGVSRGN